MPANHVGIIARVPVPLGLRRYAQTCADPALVAQPHPAHRIYPYLLRDLQITRPNHVWCTDVTYIPLQLGFLYLVAVMDWASRKVLSWRLSNTLDAHFCVEALARGARALWPSGDLQQRPGQPIHQRRLHRRCSRRLAFASRWTARAAGWTTCSIERLWRSLKYECVYLSEFATGSQARTGIGWWMDFYDRRRPHSALNDRTPAEAYTDDGADGSPGLCPGSRQPKVA